MREVDTITIQCPECGGLFAVEWRLPQEGRACCATCGAEFPIAGGVLDLRGGMPRLRRRATETWDLDAFERGYREIGAYDDNLAWARRAGIPEEIERYRHARTKGRIASQFRPRAGGLYLDLGCGGGYFIFQIKEQNRDTDYRVVGLDVSHEHVSVLSARVARERAAFVLPMLSPAEALPFPNDLFDGIICSEVLEHVLGKETAVQEMFRTLKPGGDLFLTTPSRTAVDLWNAVFWLPRCLYRLAQGKGPWPEQSDVYDSPVTASRLGALLRGAGFERVEVRRSVYLPHESYLQFLPRVPANLTLWLGSALELRMNHAFRWLGLSLMARCRKP